MGWGSPLEKERRNRVLISMYAYAYEFLSSSLVSDHEFDKLSYSVQKDIPTGREEEDKFFREEFEPATGMWIRKHPRKNLIRDLVIRHYHNQLVLE